MIKSHWQISEYSSYATMKFVFYINSFCLTFSFQFEVSVSLLLCCHAELLSWGPQKQSPEQIPVQHTVNSYSSEKYFGVSQNPIKTSKTKFASQRQDNVITLDPVNKGKTIDSFCLQRTRLEVIGDMQQSLFPLFSIEEFSCISQIKRFFHFNAVNQPCLSQTLIYLI